MPIAVLTLSLQPERAQTQGTTFIVKTTADTVDAKAGDGICADSCGNCTLRAAIMEANAFSGDDTIDFEPSVFNVPQTIKLTIPGVNEDYNATGDLDILYDLTITGPGANLTTIDAGGIDRVFDIRPDNPTKVRISGLTVTGGKTLGTQPGGGSGGGITTHGSGNSLTLTNVAVSGNTADYGGGIFVGGPVTLNNCTVNGNSAYSGGGINNYANGPLTLNNSTVSGNSAGYGGGIGDSNYGPTLTLNNCTVSGNTTPNGSGMGLRSQGTVYLKNTILANTAGLYGNCDFLANANLVSLGNNLSTDNSCTTPIVGVSGGLNKPTDLNNTPAQLAPLALNLPGSTNTHALLPGSPAIDKGGDCLPVDQRGVPRPQGAACDIGAYEVGTAPTGSCVNPPPGLKGWWPLDETTGTTAADIIGGHNGTALPGPIGAFAGSGPVTSASWPSPPFPPGKVGSSLFFDGNRRVEVPHDSALEPGTGDFTVDAWVFYAAVGNGRLLTVAQKNTGATAAFGNTLDGWRFVIRDSSPTQGLLSFRGSLSLGGSVEEPITPNTWHHVSATLSTTSGFRIVKHYVDGVSSGQVGLNGNITSTAPLLIGGDGIGGGPIAVDEVEIFNRALTQQEIQAIFNAGSGGKCKCTLPTTGLVSWWSAEGNANDIQDGNNGTLVNGATFAAGKVGQAFSFDGVDDYVELGQPANLMPSNTDFTVAGWILVPDYPNNSPESRCGSNYPIIGFDWGWSIRVSNEGRVAFGKYTALKTGVSVESTSVISTNTFHHFAAVHTVSELRIYVDGVLAGTQASPTGTIFYYGGPDTLQIGQVHCGIGKWNGKGLIGELAFYSRALTLSEIQGIYSIGNGGGCKTVVSPNQAPVANAGQTVEATSPSGASVTLNGSGSSDPNSDPLTYNWTGPFGAVSGVSPTVTLKLGTHTVTLTVNDGHSTATDTINITVRDTTAPDTIINSVVDGNGAAVASGGATPSPSITFTFGGTDAVGVAGFQCSRDGSAYAPCSSPVGYSTLAIGSHNLQARALDATGNVDPSPVSFNWTVVTPPQAVQNLMITIGNMGLPGGVANSLSNPLGQASKLLNDNNPKNDNAACGKLNDFIKQVNARAQNGKLTPAQASQLLTAASAIKTGLGC